VEWLSPGVARVIARLPVTELEELFGITVDAEDVETVGGLLAHELGRVPIAGAEATVAGLRLTAENLAGRRNKLGTVLVERIDGKRAPAEDDRTLSTPYPPPLMAGRGCGVGAAAAWIPSRAGPVSSVPGRLYAAPGRRARTAPGR
jgi:hypothetical protein